MNKKKLWKTAAEIMAELNADPTFVARKKRQDEEFAHRAKALAQAERPLVEDLCANGIKVKSVYDLVNYPTSSRRAIKVLLRHLDYDYPERIREGIIRALSVPAAAGIATPRLIEEFKRLPSTSLGDLKWLVGNALTEALTKEHVDEVMDLVKNQSHGHAREMLVFALVRFKEIHPKVVEVLKTLANDPEIGGAVNKALKGEPPENRGEITGDLAGLGLMNSWRRDTQ